MCVETTSRERPWAAPPLSSKARMKAVGKNPLARYVGQETGARPPPTPAAQPPNTTTTAFPRELAQRVLGPSQGRVVAGLGGLAESLQAVSHARCLLRGVVLAGRR